MDVEQLREALGRALAPVARQFVCAYLFGSYARGEASPGSDIDIGVLFHQEPSCSLDGLGMDVADVVEEVTGKASDVVVLNNASPDLVHRVLRDGILIFDNDSSARIQFEVRSRAEYLDVLPYIREYRRATEPHRDRH